MKYPRTKDDYWFNKVTNAEPKRIYRKCPRCGMKVGIPETRQYKFCYMCNATIHVDEWKNERDRKRYKFFKMLEKKGVRIHDKKHIRGKKI